MHSEHSDALRAPDLPRNTPSDSEWGRPRTPSYSKHLERLSNTPSYSEPLPSQAPSGGASKNSELLRALRAFQHSELLPSQALKALPSYSQSCFELFEWERPVRFFQTLNLQSFNSIRRKTHIVIVLQPLGAATKPGRPMFGMQLAMCRSKAPARQDPCRSI